MLSFETRNRLADLFLAISDGERQIEIVRQILCEQIDFEPYAAFRRIDRSRKGAIDVQDIHRFLADSKLNRTEDNCRAFINRYDVDGDGKLEYNEFLCAVLPMDNPTLRTIATQRPNYDVAEDQLLSYDVEYSLSKIIDREISFYIGLEYQKASLYRCPDFDVLLAFSAINPGPGKIAYDKLEAFFHKLAIYPSEDELVACLRRLDRDDDGCLTFEEFSIGLQSIDRPLANTINRFQQQSRAHASPIKSRVFSPARTATQTSEVEVRSPNRAFIESLRRPASPLRTSNILRATSPLRRSNGLRATSPALNSSLRKAASPRRVLSPSRVISPSRSVTNAATLRFNRSSPLQESYAARSYIEERVATSPVKFAAKESQAGFRSTASTLKFTERPSSPFRATLNNMSVRIQSSPLRQSDLVSKSPRPQETLKRSAYGESSATRILLKSSEKSILKKNGLYYAMSVSSSDKSQNFSAKKENKKTSKFESSEARDGLLDTLKQFIQLEKELETRKQDLALRSDFNLLDFFRVFDVDERGAVSSIEIKEGLEKFNVIASKEQLYLFLRRFDRDNDGRLRFSDFAEAFTCKQAEYANLLNNRTPVKGDSDLDINHPFSETTMNTIAKALRTHLDNEISIEGLRQRLTRRYKLNAHEGFVYLDLKEDGVVTNDEIGEILEKSNCYATQKEVGLVIDRMDINKDGKVTYSEFVQEMTPKSDQTF